MRERILKINSWASLSPADWLSGASWVSFKFVVATAAGQDVERVRGDSSQLWILGLWGSRNQTFLIPHTAGGTFGGKILFFFGSSDPPLPNLSHHISLWGQKLPWNHPKSPSSIRRAERGCSGSSGGPGLPMMPSGRPGPRRPRQGCQCCHPRRPDDRCLGQGQVPQEGVYSECK